MKSHSKSHTFGEGAPAPARRRGSPTTLREMLAGPTAANPDPDNDGDNDYSGPNPDAATDAKMMRGPVAGGMGAAMGGKRVMPSKPLPKQKVK